MSEQAAAAAGTTRRTLDTIRSMILSGELLPGQQLRQIQLAERLGVSRAPVREALTTLVSEGVVVHTPHTGYAVARFNLADLREIFLMRDLLENELLRRVRDYTPAMVAGLESTNEGLKRAAQRVDVSECLRLNREFHLIPLRGAGMPLVLAQIEQLWNQSDFYRSLFYYHREALAGLGDDHEEIIDLARANDWKGVAKAFNRHRRDAAERLDESIGYGRHPLLAT